MPYEHRDLNRYLNCLHEADRPMTRPELLLRARGCRALLTQLVDRVVEARRILATEGEQQLLGDTLLEIGNGATVPSGALAKVSASMPCFLRLVSWMRAKLRANTATQPRKRGSMAACSRDEPSP